MCVPVEVSLLGPVGARRDGLDPEAGTYVRPAEHALALAVVDAPAYVVGCAEIIAGQYLTAERPQDAFRSGGGIDPAYLRAACTASSCAASGPSTSTDQPEGNDHAHVHRSDP